MSQPLNTSAISPCDSFLLVFASVSIPEAGDEQPEEDVKPTPDALLGNDGEQMLIKALDGFLLVLSEEGDITYASANITELLGLQQVKEESQILWNIVNGCN